MYEVDNQTVKQIVIRPGIDERRAAAFGIAIYVFVFLVPFLDGGTLLDIIFFEALFMSFSLAGVLSFCKTITLNKWGMVIECWFIRKQYDWSQLKLWETESMNLNANHYVHPTYEKEIVIAPIAMKTPQFLTIETVEMFFKPLTFAIIRYKPKKKLQFNEAYLRNYDKDKLLTKLDEWGAINLEEWKRKYRD